MTDEPKLRVGLILGAGGVPAWVASLIEQLDASPSLETVAFTEAAPPARRPTPALRAYERADAALFGERGNGAERPQASPLPEGGTVLAACDVALRLGSGDPASLPVCPRYGVWSLSHVEEARRGTPPLFWEMARGTIYRTALVASLPGGERRLLYESWGRPSRTSLERTRREAYAKAGGAIMRALEALARSGTEYLRARPPAPDEDATPPGAPTTARVARHVAAVAGGVIGRRLRKAVLREEWFVAVRRGAEFTSLAKPRNEEHADPFVLRYDGATFLFFERYHARAGKAAIAYTRLDETLRPEPAEIALQPAHHVSYPFVFRHDGDVFMIPESLARESVDLYRASEFPSSWTLERRLLTGVRAVDATVLEEEGRLWLFANVAEPGASVNDELHLFWADTLEGPWRPHPGNPVVSDVRRARPAGAVFRRDGALIRPSQDCSSGYGTAVVFNRIEELTTEEYRETPVGRLDATWERGLVGTHTYNGVDNLAVVDGRRFALRFPLDRVQWRKRGPR